MQAYLYKTFLVNTLPVNSQLLTGLLLTRALETDQDRHTLSSNILVGYDVNRFYRVIYIGSSNKEEKPLAGMSASICRSACHQ